MSVAVILAFLTGGTSVALINLYKWWVERRDKLAEGKVPSVLKDLHEVYHVINIVLRETEAHRVVINRVENGGAIPMVGKDLYESVIFEAYDGEMKSVKKGWQRQVLDEVHVRMLLKISEKQNVTFRTSKMAACNVKDNHEANNVVVSDAYAIKSVEGAFYYLCVHFNEEGKMNSEYRDLLRYAVNTLNKLIGN